jgi:HSP20 family protein
MNTAIEQKSKQTQFRRVRPVVDVYESDAEYQVQVELPGVKNEDIGLTLEQDAMRLEATRKTHVSEPIVYDRTFSVPDAIDRDQVKAVLQNGVLSLTLPKRAAHQPRQIPVGSG